MNFVVLFLVATTLDYFFFKMYFFKDLFLNDPCLITLMAACVNCNN